MAIQLVHYMDDPITYSILATMDCPFTCGHCMYECKPGNTGYVSHEILNAMRNQVATLEECGYRVTVNIVGGEPTNIPKEFDRVLEHVTSWATDISMVTNGWWLADEDAARSVINSICKWAGQLIEYDQFTVRVSNDRYHKSCWNEICKWSTPSAILQSLKDGVSEIEWSSTIECAECGEERDDDGSECVDCGCEDIEYRNIEFIHYDTQEYKWIYCEPDNPSWTRDDASVILPQGRAASFGYNDHSQNGTSHSDCGHHLTFDPKGNLTDVCCRGSQCLFGTVYDNPAYLMKIVQDFIEEMHPDCYECRDAAKAWAKVHLEEKRRTTPTDIDRYIIGDRI